MKKDTKLTVDQLKEGDKVVLYAFRTLLKREVILKSTRHYPFVFAKNHDVVIPTGMTAQFGKSATVLYLSHPGFVRLCVEDGTSWTYDVDCIKRKI